MSGAVEKKEVNQLNVISRQVELDMVCMEMMIEKYGFNDIENPVMKYQLTLAAVCKEYVPYFIIDPKKVKYKKEA